MSFSRCKCLCSPFLDWRGQRGGIWLLPRIWPPCPSFSLVLQYSLQEMLRKSRVMEFMKFKLCFNENVFSISASLGAWDWTVIVGTGWGLGLWMNESGGVSALQSLSPSISLLLSIQRLVCFVAASGSVFVFSCPKGPGVFLLGLIWLSGSEWQWHVGEERDGGSISWGWFIPPLCSWSCLRCPLSVLLPIKGENYNSDSKAFGKTH